MLEGNRLKMHDTLNQLHQIPCVVPLTELRPTQRDHARRGQVALGERTLRDPTHIVSLPFPQHDDYVRIQIRELETQIARHSQQIRLLRLVLEAGRFGEVVVPDVL
jgi:hypothetical protein